MGQWDGVGGPSQKPKDNYSRSVIDSCPPALFLSGAYTGSDHFSNSDSLLNTSPMLSFIIKTS